jgi:hypothetical protein
VDHFLEPLVAVLDAVAALAEVIDAGVDGHGAGDGVEADEGDPCAGVGLQLGEDAGALRGASVRGCMIGHIFCFLLSVFSFA